MGCGVGDPPNAKRKTINTAHISLSDQRGRILISTAPMYLFKLFKSNEYRREWRNLSAIYSLFTRIC